MSHSERNLSRIPKAKRRRLTFAVTVSAPTGRTLPQWQTFIKEAILAKMIAELNIETAQNIVVKLLKTTTEYGGDDAES